MNTFTGRIVKRGHLFLLLIGTLFLAAPVSAQSFCNGFAGAISPLCKNAAAGTAASSPRGPVLNNSQVPGSVIVFPKFVQGLVVLPELKPAGASQLVEVPATEIEIGVMCPSGVSCSEAQTVRIRFHWICPPSVGDVCSETDFDVTASVGEKIVFTPNGGPTTDGVSNKVVPPAGCPKGYLIGWVVGPTNDQPIKFDALTGDGVIRVSRLGEAVADEAYGAIPVQADPALATGAPVLTPAGALAFDGQAGHYTAVTGRVFGDVRYPIPSAPITLIDEFITLLTLDVLSDRPNNPVFVNLDFFGGNPSVIGNENVLSTSTEFICWTEQKINTINASLTQDLMGRKGVFCVWPGDKGSNRRRSAGQHGACHVVRAG